MTEINAFGYAGTIAAFNHGEPWRRELIQYLRANRDYLYEFVQTRLPQLKLLPMQATYLAWLDAHGLGVDNAAKFFEDAGVGLSPGSIFGDAGKGYVRLNFGCPRATLKEALERMERAMHGRK